MESLYLLLPLSVLLVLALIGVFAWAIHAGQFDDLEREGWRLLEETDGVASPPQSPNSQGAKLSALDLAQAESTPPLEESPNGH